jgi:C_GCAxxG_C_C family probable redox protein
VSGIEGAHVAGAARAHHSNGENCAQSVLAALAEKTDLPASLGAGFRAGVGSQGCICGALAGAVMVLGEYAAGRGIEPAATERLANDLAARMHERFAERFGSTCCRVLKRGQQEGSDEWLADCTVITEETARMAAGLIAEHECAAPSPRWSGRDVLAVARRWALDGFSAAALALVIAPLVNPKSAPAAFAWIALTVGIAALGLEIVGAKSRFVGRLLRGLGVLAAASLAVWAALDPVAAFRVIDLTAGDTSTTATVVRSLLAVEALVLAAAALFSLKRYR